MKEINILLVDDHKLIRDGIKSIINTVHNISVVAECGNGGEAIDYLDKNADAIDVVLMDIAAREHLTRKDLNLLKRKIQIHFDRALVIRTNIIYIL